MYTTVGGIRKESNITFFVLLYISHLKGVSKLYVHGPRTVIFSGNISLLVQADTANKP